MFAAIIAALGMCFDGVAEGLYAVRHGFSARAAGIGYAIGAVLAWIYGAVTPITFTVESITIATRTATSRPQILYIVALSAVPSIILGLFGLYSRFIDLLDISVIGGVIAGVGIILTRVGFEYIKERPTVAGLSTLAGAAAWFITENLVVVIVAAVVLSTVVARFVPAKYRPGENGEEKDQNKDQQGENNGGQEAKEQQQKNGESEEQDEDRFGLIPFKWGDMLARPVLVGAFSVFALRTGAVVSYSTVNAELAGQDPTLDGVTLMAGAGSLASALFGGGPVETTPAPMAAAPMPIFSTVLFMALMAGVTLFGLVKKVGTFVPLQAIAGFLIVLGIPVIMPEQLPLAIESPLPGGAALVVTALTNPFYGLIVGEIIVLLTGII